jgi:hypothetical protein
VGSSTVIVNRVAGPISTSANPERLNSATPRAAASYSDSAAMWTEWVTPAPSVNDTRQELGMTLF